MIVQQSAGHNHNGNSYRLFFTSALFKPGDEFLRFYGAACILVSWPLSATLSFQNRFSKKRQARTGAFTTSIRMNVLSSLFIGKKLDWTEK